MKLETATAAKLSTLGAFVFWMNGEVFSSSEGGISVWDHGFLYGDGAFEGIRIFDRRIYRYWEHMRRMRRSLRMLRIETVYTDAELLDAIREVVRSNELTDAHVRVIVTRGIGLPSLDPRNCGSATTLVLAYPFPPTLGDAPIDLSISSVVRKAPRSVDPAAKTLSYVDSVLAKLQAIEAGAADAVLLDSEGFVAEATGANVFVVDGDAITTPECSAALPGITRAVVIELAAAAGIDLEVRRVTPGELYAAEEVFLTGTGAGIVSVRAVDGRALPTPPGPVTQLLRERYRETWTEEVSTEPC